MKRFISRSTLLMFSFCLLLGSIAQYDAGQNKQNSPKSVVIMDRLDNKDKNSNPYLHSLHDALAKVKDITLTTEVTSIEWNNYRKIYEMNPDLIIMHLNCFLAPEKEMEAYNKLISFLKSMYNRKTKFLMYSGAMGMDGTGSSTYIISTLEEETRLFRRIKTFAIIRENPQARFPDPNIVEDLQKKVTAMLK